MNRFVSFLKSVLGKKKKYDSCANCEFWGNEAQRLNNYEYRHCTYANKRGLAFTHRDYVCLWMKRVAS